MLLDDLLHALVVELECLGDVIEDAEVVHDESVGLRRRIDPVGPGDRLEEIVLLQRLVEVLRVEDRRVKARQQLGGDDDDLQRIGRVVEAAT